MKMSGKAVPRERIRGKPEYYGPGIWDASHRLVRRVPVSLIEQRAVDVANIYASFPCNACNKHIRSYMCTYEMPVSKWIREEDEEALFFWTVDVHNWVNESIGKPIMSHSEAASRYSMEMIPDVKTLTIQEKTLYSRRHCSSSERGGCTDNHQQPSWFQRHIINLYGYVKNAASIYIPDSVVNASEIDMPYQDTVRCITEGDRIAPGSSRDRIAPATGRDRIAPGSSRDRIAPATGRDRIAPGSSRDRIAPGSSRDRIAPDSSRDHPATEREIMLQSFFDVMFSYGDPMSAARAYVMRDSKIRDAMNKVRVYVIGEGTHNDMLSEDDTCSGDVCGEECNALEDLTTR